MFEFGCFGEFAIEFHKNIFGLIKGELDGFKPLQNPDV
jgi:hypothetical protein